MDNKYYSYPKSRPQDAFGCTLVYNNKAAWQASAMASLQNDDRSGKQLQLG